MNDDLLMNKFALTTEGYSGADLVQICCNAGLIALRENINADFIEERHLK